MDLQAATDWVRDAVQDRIEGRMGALKPDSRLRVTREEWDRAQQAVEALMAVGGPHAVAPQTTIFVPTQPQ